MIIIVKALFLFVVAGGKTLWSILKSTISCFDIYFDLYKTLKSVQPLNLIATLLGIPAIVFTVLSFIVKRFSKEIKRL